MKTQSRLAGLFGVTAIAASALVVAAAPAERAQAEMTCPAAVWDAGAAIAAAVACGGRVEVESLRGESTQTFATPMEELERTQTLLPERVQRADGTWVTADATLTVGSNGEVVPVASTVDMWFPSGGAAPTVVTRLGETEMLLTLDGVSGQLAAPTLSGNTATYAEVMPGVDLQLTADVAGFTHVLVVKTPEAAANPLVREATFTTEVENGRLEEVPGESIQLIGNDSAAPLLSTGTAIMWDSRGELADAESRTVEVEAERDAATATMDVAMNGDQLTVTADAAMLDDPDTVYPVYIDPSWTGYDSEYATLTDREGSYVNAPHPPTNTTEGALKVGFTNYDKVFAARTLFKMPIAARIKGAKVSSATFSITQGWSWKNGSKDTDPKCEGGVATGLYKIPGFDKKTTWNTGWNSSGSGWKNWLSDNRALRKHTDDDCGTARVEWNATSGVRSAVADEKTSIYLGLKSADEDSTDGWKKYWRDAELTIIYNSRPKPPTAVKIGNAECVTGADRPPLGDGTPGDGAGQVVTAIVDDPDLDKDATSLTAQVWWKPLGDTWPTNWSENPQLKQGMLGADGPVHIELPELPDGAYSVRVRAMDKAKYAGKHKDCEFSIDSVRPGTPPAVTSTDYPPLAEFPDGDPNSTKGVGQTGAFIITPPTDSDILGYQVCVNEVDCDPSFVKAVASGTTSFQLTPVEYGRVTVYVRAKDKAGNVSEDPYIYEFHTKSTSSPPVAEWDFEHRNGAIIVDPVGGKSLQPFGVPSVGEGHVLADHGVKTSTTAGYSIPGDRVVDTAKSFSIDAWVMLISRTNDQTVVSISASMRPGVYLKYKSNVDRWNFTFPGTNTTSPSWYEVFSDAAPTLNRWTHLAGTYNQTTSEIKLYVDGVLQEEDDNDPIQLRPTVFTSPGPLWVGQAAKTTEAPYHGFTGRIDEVRMWNRVMAPSEVVNEATMVSYSGSWALDSYSGTPGQDDSVHNRPLTVGQGVAATDENTALQLSGTGCLTAPGPGVYTNRSFSASLWARLDDKSTSRMLLSQAGANRSSFLLEYNATDDRWRFAMSASDASGTVTITKLNSPHSPLLHQWTHLAITFDVATGKMNLFVNGTRVDANVTHAGAWHATGVMKAGCADPGSGGANWIGAIDDVHVFTGVLAFQDAGSPAIKLEDVITKAGKVAGTMLKRPADDRQMIVEFDAGGNASITGLTPIPGTAEWSEQVMWSSPTSDYYPATTTVVFGQFDDESYIDAAVLHESHTVAKYPNWTHSVIISRTVTLTVLHGDEYGLNPVESEPQLMEHITGTPENPTAPGGAWYPGATPMAAGDIDADGDDELIATADGRSCQGGPRIFASVGGDFTTPAVAPAGAIDWCLLHTARPIVTDMNGDGAEDLAVTATAISGVGARTGVYRAIGNGTLTPPALAWSSSSAAWNAANFTAISGDPGIDAYGDLAVMRKNTTTATWTFDVFTTTPGSMSISGPGVKATPSGPSLYANAIPGLVDADQDGDADLTVVYRDGESLSVWLYANINGSFGPETHVWTRELPTA